MSHNPQNAFEIHNAQSQFAQQPTAGIAPMLGIAPTPNEPTIVGAVSELLNFIATAEMHLADFRSVVFGEGESELKQETPTTMDAALRTACTRVACICGQLATINQRFGTGPGTATPKA